MKFYISCLILLFCQFQSNNSATNLCECGENEGGKHSWHTLIYVQDGSGDFKPFCNGILTSPWTVITAYTCIHNAKKNGSDDTIKVGIGDLSQHTIGAKMVEFRDSVAILELERRIDFAKPVCLGKPNQGTFILTTISNDSKSLLVKDAASVDDDHCSSRKFTDKCLKIQDGLPCSSLLGGPLLQFDRQTKKYSVVGLVTSVFKKKCHINHKHLTYHPLTSTIDWILDQIGDCHCPYCKVDRRKLECNPKTISGEFPKKMFVQCPNIQQEVDGIKILQMDHQKITRLALDDFKHFPNAVFVDFSNNQIDSVDFTVGNQVMPKLRQLKLERNKISKLPEGSLDRFPRLEEIDLSLNPIKHYTTLSWPFCYAHTHSMKDNPVNVIGKVTFHKFYGYDHQHLKNLEESFCEELKKKGKRHIKECVKEDEKTMDCTDLDLGTEDINSLSCFVDSASEDSILILKFPEDQTLHSEDDLAKCSKIDISKTLLSDAAKFNRIKEVVTIHAITFDLSSMFHHVNLKFIKEVIIRADTVILNKPIEISFKLKIRARKVILNHPITLKVCSRDFKELTNHLFIERHIKYSEKTFSRQRKYALIDIVDSVPKNYKKEGHCKPATYAPEDLKDDNDWYDVMAINLMYICAHTLMKDKVHDQSQEMATWHFEFNELRMNQGKVSPFATSEKFQSLLHFTKHPTLHRVPARSLESITKLSLILKDSFRGLDVEEKFLQANFSRIQNTMDILFSQLSIAEDTFERYYEGELQNLEQLFNTTDTVIDSSKEDTKILIEKVQNESKKTRKVLSDKLQQSTDIIQEKINKMGQNNMVAFIAIANLSTSNHVNNFKVHQDMIEGKSLELRLCKDLILKTRKRLDESRGNLEETIKEVKTAVAIETAVNAAKSIFQIIQIATTGTGDPMSTVEKLEKAAKMIDLIIKLAKILKNMIEGIIDSDEFKRNVNFKSDNEPLPTDFLKAIQEANKMRENLDIFEKIDSEGIAFYNDISASSDYAPSAKLKMAIDAVVNKGKTLVRETIRYSDILIELTNSKNKLEVAKKGKKLGDKTMHNFNRTLNNLKDESKKDPIKLSSEHEFDDVLSKIKPTDFLNLTNSAKMEFKKKILQSLDNYRNEHKIQEQNKRQKFFEITEVVAASVHQTKIESTTQRLMLHDLFNEYCDAKFYTTFKACNESMTPDISTDYGTFAKRITLMNIDEHLSSGVDTAALDEFITINDTQNSKDISKIDVFKQTKSVDLCLADFMDSWTWKRYFRLRVSSIYVRPLDEFGHVIYNNRRVRIQVIYPAKFTDTNKNGQKYEFVIQPNSCYSEYDKPLPSSTHEKKRPCKINPEEAVSPNGTFTFTILDYEIDMERVSSLLIEIEGKQSGKDSRSSKQFFRQKIFAKLPTKSSV